MMTTREMSTPTSTKILELKRRRVTMDRRRIVRSSSLNCSESLEKGPAGREVSVNVARLQGVRLTLALTL